MDNISPFSTVQLYSLKELTPARSLVLSSMGIEKGDSVPDDVQFLFDEAMKIYIDLAKPIGLLKNIYKDVFLEISEGISQTEKRYPLQDIVPKAEMLALFAFTLGEKISNKIQQLIQEKDFPLGYALDIIASRSAEQASLVQEKRFGESSGSTSSQKALLYSPGYCGWDITAQQRIFNYLEPQKIGIKLNESSLMFPIKSVTGILIAGDHEIHNFKNNFSFCRNCETFSCLERMKA